MHRLLALAIVVTGCEAPPSTPDAAHANVAAEASVLRTYPDTGASQGVAVDEAHVYAVSNSKIVKFDKQTEAKVAEWAGDPARYPHFNSCAVIAAELVCASSNYPAVPMVSTVEVLDPQTMTIKRSIPLEGAPGSVTFVDHQGGDWWVGFANYDDRGGAPGRDHTFTTLVRYDAAWKEKAQWRFPKAVLGRFAPKSASGGAFGDDGLLYVSGHDRPEIYALRAPEGGGELQLVATLPMSVAGQAIAWDPTAKRHLYGISRATGAVVAMLIPPVAP